MTNKYIEEAFEWGSDIGVIIFFAGVAHAIGVILRWLWQIHSFGKSAAIIVVGILVVVLFDCLLNWYTHR